VSYSGLSLTLTVEKIASSVPSVSLSDAIASAETSLNGKFNEWPATLEYFAKDDGSAVLTHVVQIENDETGAWFEAFVDAHTGDVVSVTDFVAHASVSTLFTLSIYLDNTSVK
jgi:extracellular elastinolytic metalloproteinase